MEDVMIATHLESLDRRLAKVEQILPTLTTKEELDEKLAAQSAELRRHMNVLNEAVRSDIQLLAEHVASETPKPRKG